MTVDPRSALSVFVAALETHLETAAVRRGKDDPSVVAAYERVAEAFAAYDDALDQAYGEVTPLEVYDDTLVSGDDDEGYEDDEGDDDFDDDDDDDDGEDDDGDEEDEEDFDDDDEDDDQTYQGLDDEEYDVDTDPRG